MEQSTHEIRVKEWSKIIQDCYTSGLTQKEWCMQNHINEKSFYYWQRVIRKETLAKCPLLSSDVQTTFVELPSPKFSAEVPMNEPAAIIRLTGGITIEITETASSVFIRQLIRAVSYAE